mgnify:CR=1 FL=1
MYDVNDLPSLPVYEWDRAKKRAFLDAELTELTDWHAARCPPVSYTHLTLPTNSRV